jgi:monoamine oxidase
MMKSAMVYERPFWRDAGLSGQSFRIDDGVPVGMGFPPDEALG